MAVVALATATAATLAGCPDKKPKYPSCNKDGDCQEGEKCVDKKCVQCATDDDCGEGTECVAGACVRKEGWCGSDADCADGKVCKNNQCVACQQDVECPGGGRCEEGRCLGKGDCTQDEDCADDEDCVDGKCKGYGAGTDPNLGCQLVTIYFDFDASGIREDMRRPLESTAECVNRTDRGIYVIGHTDPQGTEEYNIALSEGRARAVADYIARLGVDPARMRIIPKGETESAGGNESTWKQDRRVEFDWQ